MDITCSPAGDGMIVAGYILRRERQIDELEPVRRRFPHRDWRTYETEYAMTESLEHVVRTAIVRSFPDADGVSILEAHDHSARDSTADWTVRVRFTTSGLTRIENLIVMSIPADAGARDEQLSQSLRTQELPVPRVLLSQPDEIQSYLVREFVPGTSLAQLLTDSSMRWEISAHGFTFARMLARIHNIDWRALLPWLGDAEALPEDLVTDQLNSWFEEWQGWVTESPEQYQGIVQDALTWIDENRPYDASVCLCHGDFRPSNIIIDGDEISAVVGWEHALITDASFDLCLLPFEVRQLGLPEDDADLLAQAIFGAYLQSSSRSLGNMQFYAVVRLLDAAIMSLDPELRSLNKIAAFSTDAEILFEALQQAMSTGKKGLWKL